MRLMFPCPTSWTLTPPSVHAVRFDGTAAAKLAPTVRRSAIPWQQRIPQPLTWVAGAVRYGSAAVMPAVSLYDAAHAQALRTGQALASFAERPTRR